MNQYTELLYYIKKLADSDPLVNKVTQADLDKISMNKMDIAPLVHITINSGSFTNGSTVNFSVELAALNLLDSNPEVNTDEFLFNDNEADCFNETHAILNRIFSRMVTDFEKENIIASENGGLQKVDGVGVDGLIGWLLTFDVEIPNNKISLCQYPI